MNLEAVNTYEGVCNLSSNVIHRHVDLRPMQVLMISMLSYWGEPSLDYKHSREHTELCFDERFYVFLCTCSHSYQSFSIIKL